MKQFYTVVLDRLASFSGRFDSEPYETGWADELIAFVRVHEKAQCTALRAWLQISPDGIEWIDEGTSAALSEGSSLLFMKARDFGGWVRLCVECDDECKVTTYLALKG